MRNAVAELAALVDAARRFGSGMAADAAGEGKLLEEALHPRQVFALFRIDFGVCAFEIGLRKYGRRSVAGAADKDRIQVVLFNQPIEVDVSERLPGIRTPVAEQPRLEVLQSRRLAEQRIVLEVHHTQAEIEARPPVSVYFV
jgi:hypothetical protein